MIPDVCEHRAFWWECVDCQIGDHALRRAALARMVDERTRDTALPRLVYAEARLRRLPWWRRRARREAVADRERIEAEVAAARDRLDRGDYLPERAEGERRQR